MPYPLRQTSHIISLLLCLVLSGCVRFEWPDSTLTEDPMPLIDEGVLWISSVPLGARVVVFEKEADKPDGPKAGMQYMYGKSELLDQHTSGPFARASAGKTPLAVKVPPGKYCIGVQINVKPDELQWGFCQTATFSGMMQSAEIYSSVGAGRIGHEGIGLYLNDGNLEEWVLCDENGVTKAGKTYEVEKKEGETATVIALFQRKEVDPDRMYETLPDDYRFRNRLFMSPEGLEIFGIPKSESKLTYRMLMRGGKVLYSDGDFHFMCELIPLGQSSGGFKISSMGNPHE